ncbi:MAG: hypothetical protein R3C18_14000 [Planctomycetaceae bacterium]
MKTWSMCHECFNYLCGIEETFAGDEEATEAAHAGADCKSAVELNASQ